MKLLKEILHEQYTTPKTEWVLNNIRRGWYNAATLESLVGTLMQIGQDINPEKEKEIREQEIVNKYGESRKTLYTNYILAMYDTFGDNKRLVGALTREARKYAAYDDDGNIVEY